jgi:hypothetical protein
MAMNGQVEQSDETTMGAQIVFLRRLKIIDDCLLAGLFENIVDKFNVQRMYLVIVLRLLVGKNDIERDLVGLIDHGPVAGGHFAGVKMQDAWNGPQVFFHAGQKFVGGFRVGGIGPEYDNV